MKGKIKMSKSSELIKTAQIEEAYQYKSAAEDIHDDLASAVEISKASVSFQPAEQVGL